MTVLAPAASVARLPDRLDFVEAAPHHGAAQAAHDGLDFG